METQAEKHNDRYAKLRDHLNAPPAPPYEAATKFLHIYFADSDSLDESFRSITVAIVRNDRPVTSGMAGIKGLLADDSLKPGTLAYLVAWEANWVLDDTTDKGAEVWLKQIAASVEALFIDHKAKASVTI